MDTSTPQMNTLSYFFFAFIAMVGTSYINFLPGMVNTLAGGIGFSEVEAGEIVALNIYGALTGCIAAIFIINRYYWKRSLFTLLVLLTIADLSTSWIDDYNTILVWRFFAGFIGGLCIGNSFSILARLASPDRAFGALLFTQFGICFVVLAILPSLEAMFDAHAVFYVMACLSVISISCLVKLPNQLVNQPSTEKKANQSINKLAVVLLMSALMLYLCAANAIWTYVGLIGRHAGMNEQSVNNYIAVTSLLGLVGALLPVITGKSFGRLFCIILGVLLSIVAAYLLSFTPITVTYYVAAMCLIFFAWPAVNSYLLAITADLDISGRLSSVAALVSLFGAASGPMMASGLIGDGNFSDMLYSCIVIFILSAIFAIRPTIKSNPHIALHQAKQT